MLDHGGRTRQVPEIVSPCSTGSMGPFTAHHPGVFSPRPTPRWDGLRSPEDPAFVPIFVPAHADRATRGRIHSGVNSQGLEEMERQRARWEDIEAGELSMPDDPTMVYNLTFETEAIDPDTADWRDGPRLHATYIPYATPEQTGLTTESNPVEPWLMWPGQPSAHIMIMIPPQTAPDSGDGGGGD